LDPVVALQVVAFPPVRRRWEGHDVEREKEARLPSVGVAYCGVDWEGDGDGWEAEQIAGVAAEGTVVGSIPAQGVRVRRFPMLAHTD
jgi:hypothetical protein